MNEFDIIRHFCSFQTIHRNDVLVESGDDCAIVQIPKRHELAITTDTLVEDVHFPKDTAPYDLGYKSLAVNLSDLAAMGATPTWVTFALTLDRYDQTWIEELARGFFALATLHEVQLIGGDLTHGPLTITLQAQGILSTGTALKRSGAKPGDKIYVSHTLGDAGLALQHVKGTETIPEAYRAEILSRLTRPEPRVALGKKLRGIANAAIDISDGLIADLSHILKKSQVGATLEIEHLPLSPALVASISYEKAIAFALNAGDDYELCFTVPADKIDALEQVLDASKEPVTCIGTITAEPELKLLDKGKIYHGHTRGYQHF